MRKGDEGVVTTKKNDHFFIVKMLVALDSKVEV